MAVELRGGPATTSAVVGAVVLAVAVGGAVLAPDAGAAAVDCTVSSVESAPSFGPTDVSASPSSVSVTVLHRRSTSSVARRTRNGWRAEVRVVARVRGAAARTVSTAVPATVESTATAVCGQATATVSVTAAATGRGSGRSVATDVRRHHATGTARKASRHSALTRARAHAVTTTKSREHVRALRALAETSTSGLVRAARNRASAAAAADARAAARQAAERKARRRAGSTPTTGPTTEPTPTTTVSSSATPTGSGTPTASVTPTVTVTSAPTATTGATTRPLLIKHGWDIPSPSFVQSHVTSMEKQPFDGLTIALPGYGNKVQSQTPVTYEQLKQALAPVAATRFTTLKHNFVMVYSAPAGDLFADWSVPAANFANLARAAKEAGFEGVFYDNEEYFGSAMSYPGNCAGHTVAQCQAQAQVRGTQVMDAMRSQWPSVRVFTTFGPWVSDPGTASHLSGVPYNDIAWANQLAGSYVVGMVASAAGTGAQVVDGGEIYTARTPAQFATVKAWQKTGMATSSALVPTSLRSQWAGTVSAAFGVYDEPWIGVGMDSSTWRTTLANALAGTDEYVWAYTEKYDWWGSGWPATPVPAEWVTATRLARGGS